SGWSSTSRTASNTAASRPTCTKPAADADSVTAVKDDRWFRAQGPGFAVALLLSVIALGTVGFMITDGRGAWDAFYITVLALTTVESPWHTSRAGQAFTVVLLLGGVGAALYTFTLLATVV